ncbi:MAG: hypothetical protein U1E53_22020 [Dongiaceae bacterium]
MADRLADHQPPLDQLPGSLLAAGEHGEPGLAQLGQAGAARPRSEASASPSRTASITAAVEAGSPASQQRRGAAEPAGAALALAEPGGAAGGEVGVPGGRQDAGAVAEARGQPRLCPGRPAGGDRHARRAAEQRTIRGGTARAAQRRHVPGADHGGDGAVGLLQRAGDAETHLRLPALLAPGGGAGQRRGVLAQRRHRRLDGGEDLRPGAGLLDHRVPPGLAVGVAGRGSQRGDRVGAQPLGLLRGVLGLRLARRAFAGFGIGSLGGGFVRLRLRRVRLRCVRLRLGEVPGGGKVDQAHRPAAGERPVERPPFRREGGQREEAGAGRPVAVMYQDGERRPHLGRRREGQHRLGLGRALDQHHGRVEGIERALQRRRRARPVMADAEQPQAVAAGHGRSQATSRSAA